MVIFDSPIIVTRSILAVKCNLTIQLKIGYVSPVGIGTVCCWSKKLSWLDQILARFNILYSIQYLKNYIIFCFNLVTLSLLLNGFELRPASQQIPEKHILLLHIYSYLCLYKSNNWENKLSRYWLDTVQDFLIKLGIKPRTLMLFYDSRTNFWL